MKNLFKIKWLLPLCAIGIFVSCTKDFDKVNTNPNAASAAPATNIFANGIVSVASTLFGTRLDLSYAGYYSGMNAA